MFDEVIHYSNTWRMKINFGKCDVILFRPSLDKANRDVRKNWRNFHIRTPLNTNIINKKTVKYLGMYLQHNLLGSYHIKAKVVDARKALGMTNKLFHNKNVAPRVKVLAYQSLIRPILTYACQIWYNISASLMEIYRKFERKILRACVGKYRKSETNFQHFISNKNIYESANVSRIDIFILNLVRRHYQRVPQIKENSLIAHSAFPEPKYIEHARQTGFVPPEAFPELDKNNYIQSEDSNIPLIYHIFRRATDTKIIYNPNTSPNNPDGLFRYEMSIPNRDASITSKNYWWFDA
jgi:hypothetical protein